MIHSKSAPKCYHKVRDDPNMYILRHRRMDSIHTVSSYSKKHMSNFWRRHHQRSGKPQTTNTKLPPTTHTLLLDTTPFPSYSCSSIDREDCPSMSVNNNSLLVQLSVACQKHRVQHHPNGEDDHSSECQKDLKALSVVIPKVEAEYLHSAEIAHLCDFYNDVINGGFCPHAPKLFRTGIDDCECVTA